MSLVAWWLKLLYYFGQAILAPDDRQVDSANLIDDDQRDIDLGRVHRRAERDRTGVGAEAHVARIDRDIERIGRRAVRRVEANPGLVFRRAPVDRAASVIL